MDTRPKSPTALDAPLSAERIQRIYDRIGRRYDLLRFAEAAPKREALRLLAARPGERILEVGSGTGAMLIALAHATTNGAAAPLPDSPRVEGIDLSPVMVAEAQRRIAAAGLAWAAQARSGSALALPYADATFDGVFSSYLLDLLPYAEIPQALAEMRRVLRPGARLALVALSSGSGLAARLVIRGYVALYRQRPDWLAGCRPISLEPLLQQAGFALRERHELFRWHPSEIVLAQKGA